MKSFLIMVLIVLSYSCEETEPLSCIVEVKDCSGYNKSDGQIFVQAYGGMGPYVFTLSSKRNDRSGISNKTTNTTGVFESLNADDYEITVEDIELNKFVANVTVSQPNEPLSCIVEVTDCSEYNRSDGQIFVQAYGGIGPYEFTLSSEKEDNKDIISNKTTSISVLFTGLKSGNYEVTVEDIELNKFVANVTVSKPQIPENGLLTTYAFESNNEVNAAYALFPIFPSVESEGKIGNCLVLDGEHKFVSNSTTFQSVFDLNNKYSVSLWFKTEKTDIQPPIYHETTNHGMLFSCDGDNFFPFKRMWIFLTENGSIHFERYHGATMHDTTDLSLGYQSWGSYGFASQTNNLNDGEWHFVTVIYDGSFLNIVIDNKYWERFAGPANATRIIGSHASVRAGGTTQVTLGGNAQDNIKKFKGSIDQLRVYNIDLNALEVDMLYNEK